MTTPIQLPAGTNMTKCINLPTSGAWLGNVAVSLMTNEPATIQELVFLYPNAPDGKKRYRRTGGTVFNDYKNWTLSADQKFIRWLVTGECGMILKYTATADISLNVETTRSIKPYDYPLIPLTPYPTETALSATSAIAGKVYWK